MVTATGWGIESTNMMYTIVYVFLPGWKWLQIFLGHFLLFLKSRVMLRSPHAARDPNKPHSARLENYCKLTLNMLSGFHKTSNVNLHEVHEKQLGSENFHF